MHSFFETRCISVIYAVVRCLSVRPSRSCNGQRSATHQWILFLTESLDITPMTAEQNLTVRINKSEAELTNNERLRSRNCTVDDNYW